MSGELLVLRLIHILGGIFWVGTVSYLTFFLLPAIAEAGPAGGAVMAGLQRRKLLVVLPVVALVTILSGVRLLQVTSDGFSAAYFATPMGRTMLLATLTTIGAFLIGIAVSRPAMSRVAALMAQREAATPDDRLSIGAEIERLRERGRISSLAVAIILIVSASLMAVARYL